MDNFRIPKHTSAPQVSKDNKDVHDVKNYSSVTHPSVSSRSRDHLENIFKKINSGDNILSRIPLRLDPNIEFSDDEDEDEESPATVIKKPGEECKQSDVQEKGDHMWTVKNNKKPEPPLKSLSIFDNAVNSQAKANPNSKIKPIENTLLGSFSTKKLNEFKRKSLESSKSLPAPQNIVPILPKSNVNTVLPPVNEKDPVNLINDGIRQNLNLINSVKPAYSLPNDIIEVNKKTYNVLSLLGSGGSCKVYSVYDIQDKVRVAIKRVNLKDTDPMIRRGYQQEIEYLSKLQNSNRVIKMYDFEYRENELLLVLEPGDIDFAKYLFNEAKLKRLTPLKIKFYWAQMLEAVADIHKYGIVHSDLKPANFLLVAGNLKLIDFGIATSVPEDKTSTFRENQVGTLNYMSPEAITQMSADGNQPCFKVGVKSDVWSLGCILYNLVYGITPFHGIKALMQKIYAITSPNYEIPFGPVSDSLLLDVLKSCLKRNPKERASVEQLLKHPYLAEDNISTNTASASQNPDLQNVLKQMQILTPNRMRYVSKVVQELSERSNV